MILKKAFFGIFLAIFLTSCQFTETLVLNEDGSGKMSLEMDMNEMMAFGAGMGDSIATKIDTIISMKQFLIEKKDSISQLPEKQQEKLKKLENFNIHTVMNTESGEMLFNVFTDFKKVDEANELFNGFSETSKLMPRMGNDMKIEKDESSDDIIGVSYSFKKGKFKRDAYIKDKEKHLQQVDSLKGSEAFMGSMMYTLKYTFPKRIVKSSIEDARYSLDGRTIEVERSFIEYFKNPDVLDLQVEIEK